MTQVNRELAKKRRFSGTRHLLPLLLCSVMAVFFFLSKQTASAVLSALELCLKSVVPSIFPFMVLSRLLVECGGGELFARLFGRLTQRVFGLSGSAATPIFLGALCGFPIGAVVCERLYRSGELSLDELELLIGVVSLPSPAFVINAVGVNMLGDQRKGLALYFLLLGVSLAIGLVVCRSSLRKTNDSPPALRLTPSRKRLSEVTVDAVSSSATALLSVCAYTAFFSTLSKALETALSLPETVSILLKGALEFSGGCYAASGHPYAFSLCALVLGWSGVGVHFQIMSVCPAEVSYKKFYTIIFVRALLCFAFSFVILRFFDI
ncbi:MAG: hypothetical protein IKB47_01650 [Clostridia bacterium]|nr:hypothetical protein [Clostridia bacterium]